MTTTIILVIIMNARASPAVLCSNASSRNPAAATAAAVPRSSQPSAQEVYTNKNLRAPRAQDKKTVLRSPHSKPPPPRKSTPSTSRRLPDSTNQGQPPRPLVVGIRSTTSKIVARHPQAGAREGCCCRNAAGSLVRIALKARPTFPIPCCVVYRLNVVVMMTNAMALAMNIIVSIIIITIIAMYFIMFHCSIATLCQCQALTARAYA